MSASFESTWVCTLRNSAEPPSGGGTLVVPISTTRASVPLVAMLLENALMLSCTASLSSFMLPESSTTKMMSTGRRPTSATAVT